MLIRLQRSIPLICAVWLAAATGASAASLGDGLVVSEADGSSARLIQTGLFAAPAWSPNGERLAFADEDSIDLIRPDGSERMTLVQISEFGESTGAMAWSPDGRQLAFVTDDNIGKTLLHVVGADGTGQRVIARHVNKDFATPSWSPDGRRLVFARGDSDRTRVAVVNADGTGLRRIARAVLDHDEGGAPTWSPGGRWIAYVDVTRGRFFVKLVRPDGTGRRRVSWRCNQTPSWSPDGRRIACVGFAGRRQGLYVVELARRRTTAVAKSSILNVAPAWSPDGTRLAYLTSGRGGIYLSTAQASGSGRNLLTHAALPQAPTATWSPDSRTVAYINLPSLMEHRLSSPASMRP